MSKRDKGKAPEYASTTYDTGGLFGSSTSNKNGTTYKPSGWISETMGTVSSNINPTLNNMLSNDYSNDPNFQVYQDNFNRNAQNSFETNVLNPIQSQGLMRSSGLQAATNSFNETLNNNLANLYDTYYNRQSNNLANLLNTSNTLYDYIMGLNSASAGNTNAVNNYNLAKYKIDNPTTSGSSGIGSMIGGIGNLASTGWDIYKSTKGGQ